MAAARIVVQREDGKGFDIVSDTASDDAHAPTRDTWSDRPGKTQESGYSGHHSIEPRHDPHDERKAAFVHGLAGRLNQAAAEKRCDSLVVFAPPHCLGELRGALDHAARRKIKATAPKDLTKLPLGELPRHREELGQD
jgi:protein required for attachment to host cells